MTAKSTEQRLRLRTIQAPELPTEEGKAAKAALEALVADGELEVRTYKPDQYGRWLADIRNADGLDVGTAMLTAGHATPYKS
jgi:endonuclease YncB( thermonuclease family)